MSDPSLPSESLFRRILRQPLALAAVIVITVAVVGLVISGALRFPGGSPVMDFALRQKVSAAGTLHFSFPALMEHASAEEMMTVPAGLTGTWAWTNDVLTFDPAVNLQPGKSYTFTLKGNVRKADGNILGRELDFTFTVAGPAKVALRIPEKGSQKVDPGTTITLVFDRPMIPLTQVQGAAAGARTANWPVTITPDTPGRWRWLSTVAVEYVPDKPLLPATRYTVTVPKGIPTVAGDTTEEDFSWVFETARPQVIASDPQEGYTLAGPTTKIALSFNQEMNPALLKEKVTLARTSPGTEALPIRDVAFGTTEEDGKNITDRETLLITPGKALEFSSSYTLTLQPGFQGAQGSLGNETGFTLRFSTVGPMLAQTPTFEYGRISLPFSNPLNEDTVQGQIAINPPVEGWKDVEWTVATWKDSREISAYPPLKPSTNFTLTIGTGIADTFGQHLKEPFSYSFRTEPLPSQINFDSKGAFGIFERGKPPVYNLRSVNVNRMDLELSQLTLPEFLQLRSARYNEPALPESRTVLTSWQLSPEKKTDTWQIKALDLAKETGQSLGSGIFALRVTAPEITGYDGKPLEMRQYFALTQIALTLKYTGNRILVWAVDMRSGAPVSGALIGVHNLSGEQVLSGSTDKEGFFETDLPLEKLKTSNNEWEPEFWITAEKGNDFAFVASNWSDGIRPGAFSLPENFWNEARGTQTHSFLYTDRPLYRAGDTVHFKGLVRLRDRNGQLSVPPKAKNVNLIVTDAEGNQIHSATLPFTGFGSFSGDIPIDPKAPLGYYSISAGFPETPYQEIYSSFQVLAYRKPEYRVEVKTDREDFLNGETVKAQIEGAYYFGAPLNGAKVEWRATTTDYYFNKFTDGWYAFTTEDSWCWWDCPRETEILAQGSGVLDAAGHLTVSFPATIDEQPVSQILTIEADVMDPNNQVVSNRTEVAVHKANVYVGVRSEDYVVTPGESAKIGVVTVSPQGAVLPNTSVTLELYSRDWNSIRKKGVDGEYYYENTPEDTFIKSFSAKTDEKGKATVAVPIEKGGQFVVVARAKDDRGREAKASASVYAWSSTYINWPHANNDRIDLLADKPEYAVGETATFLLKSPFQGKGVKTLITVEREQVIKRWVIDVESSAQKITLPITEDLIPDAYVSAVVIKPRMGETFDENGLDTGAPAFRIGYARLNVETSKKRLTVSITTDKEKYLPGEQVQVTLKTADWQGKPVAAELSLGVVDMSLLALTGFRPPDPVTFFYSDRGLGVRTAEMLKFLIDRYKPGSKGGGGDLEERKRGDFKDTAFWNPAILTNEKGEASLSFKLPDNLTTWQLLAIGQTREHTFGAMDDTIIETKRVILRPVRPRFAVVGDRVDLGAIVHNFTDSPQTFIVTLTGSGFDAVSSNRQKVTIQPDQLQKLLFPVTIRRAEKAVLDFAAETEGARDEVEETIPIFPYGTPQSAATTGITEEVALEKVLVPSKDDAREGSLTMTLSPTLATYLPKGLEYLVQFPYGCAEQTLSALLPQVALLRLQGFDAFRIADDKTLRSQVTTGLQRLYTFQRSDGGFGYWENSSMSFPALSAYVLTSFTMIRDSGFPVDGNVISQVRAYLQQTLRTNDPAVPLDAATRAVILFALGESGGADVSLLKNLDTQRDKLPIFAKAMLAMAFQRAGNAKAKDIIADIQNQALVDGRGTHFEEADGTNYDALMHTNQRTTALVLMAYLRINPENVLIPNTVRYLLAVRQDGHWDTTQSTTYTLLALTDYLKATGEINANYTAGLEVNGEKVLDWKVSKANVLSRKEVTMALDDLKRGAENPVKIAKAGVGRLYYDLLLSYFFAADTLPPAEEGISILRSLEPLPGQAKDVTVGNTYRATLTITVPEDRHFVAVSSPLPAGLEPIDLSLSTTQQTLLEDSTSGTWNRTYWESGLWRFTHHEFRDDAVFLFAEDLPAGVYQYTYLVRATTPGIFHERPARVWQMYFPEVFGQTEGKLMTIRE